ncbi:MAG: SseB family protein [Phycisphaerales bacterium]
MRWHHLHEDIVRSLQLLKHAPAVDVLAAAALTKHEYLAYDNSYALARKCTWALADIGTDAAREKLAALSRCTDATIAGYAQKRLDRWDHERGRKGVSSLPPLPNSAQAPTMTSGQTVDERANVALLDTLQALRADPSRVLQLYEQLFHANLFGVTQVGAALESANFLTYPTADGVGALPLFTQRRFIPSGLPADALVTLAPGAVLWRRLLEVICDDGCVAAIDPGQPHGIRLTRAMILGMVAAYGAPRGIGPAA